MQQQKARVVKFCTQVGHIQH